MARCSCLVAFRQLRTRRKRAYFGGVVMGQELHNIRLGLSDAGFQEFQKNRFRMVVGDDGLEHGAEFDVFSDHGRKRAVITLGIWHPQLNICLADVFAELGEHDRARLKGFGWLIARGFNTTNVEDVQMNTTDQPGPSSFSISEMLRCVRPIHSLSSTLRLIASDALPPGWFRQGSLLGLKMLVALSILRQRNLGFDDAAFDTASGWIARDARYAHVGVEQIAAIIDRAVQRVR